MIVVVMIIMLLVDLWIVNKLYLLGGRDRWSSGVPKYIVFVFIWRKHRVHSFKLIWLSDGYSVICLFDSLPYGYTYTDIIVFGNRREMDKSH